MHNSWEHKNGSMHGVYIHMNQPCCKSVVLSSMCWVAVTVPGSVADTWQQGTSGNDGENPGIHSIPNGKVNKVGYR